MQLHEATQSQRDFHEARKARLARMSPQAFNAALAAVEVEMAKPEPCNVVKFPVIPRTDECWIDVTNWPPIATTRRQALQPSRIRMDQIQKAVSRYFDVALDDLLGHRRTKGIVIPRMIAVSLCRSLTYNSLPQIGRAFGGRDHTTIRNSIIRVQEMVLNEPNIADAVDVLREKLTRVA